MDMKLTSTICLVLIATGGCGHPASETPSASLVVTVTAAPTCPVARVDDPACAPRPVADAEIRLQGPTSLTLTTDEHGRAHGKVAVGTYRLAPQPVNGLMGTPAPRTLAVHQTATSVSISYDTGIR